MIVMIGAKIGFFVWVAITLLFMHLYSFRRLKDLGKVADVFFACTLGYLLYVQNWTVYLPCVLLLGATHPFLDILFVEKEKIGRLTLQIYMQSVGIAYIFNLGAYGAIYALNR